MGRTRPSSLAYITLALLSASLIRAQSDSTTTSGATDPSSSNDSQDSGWYGGPVENYYYVGIAILLCLAGLGGFFFWRRKKQMTAMLNNGGQTALARDAGAWDSTRPRRRYWQGRWREDMDVEEGLNEHGEAPPPYIPKTQENGNANTPLAPNVAVPLQTLSRDDAGLKPPGYSVAEIEATEPPGNQSLNRAGSSSRPS